MQAISKSITKKKKEACTQMKRNQITERHTKCESSLPSHNQLSLADWPNYSTNKSNENKNRSKSNEGRLEVYIRQLFN